MILKQIKSPAIRIGLIVGASVLLLFLLFISSVYMGVWGKLPSKTELSGYKYQKATEVFTADSILIGKYYLHDRQPITYQSFPRHLIDALVSIEDERFFDHSGIDYRSLFRVAVKTILLQDESAGGGSTISQQLAKNLYPRSESGKIGLVVHKVKEMIIARRLETVFDKKEVLQHYLNTVSFGDNTFGIESASLKFFNKHTRELQTEEAATLVGMLKATYDYNPRIFPESGKNRRDLVLYSMAKNDYVSEEQRDSLTDLPLKLDYREYEYNSGLAPYFREEVRKRLMAWSKDQKEQGNEYNIYTSGLKVYTTLDFKMQKGAEEAMVEHMSHLQEQFEKSYGKNAPWLTNKTLMDKIIRGSIPYKKMIKNGISPQQAIDSMNQKRTMTLASWEGEKETEASIIDSITHYTKFLNTGSLSMDPHTGEVKTWIGGVNYKYYKYDHVSQSKRQVGSAFKPIVYMAALESGMDPCSYFSAEEVTYKNLEGWSPGNSGDKDEVYLNYSMKEALSNSVNTVAVKVLEKTGITKVISQANKMGIDASLPKQPSLALGTGEIGLNQMAGAYCSFVNDGIPMEPFFLKSISDNNDSILETFSPATPLKAAFSKENGEIILEMMKSTVNEGTAARIRSEYGLKNDIAGKTGTTQNNKDAWFAAVTPNLVHITWVGLEHHEIGFRNTSLGQGSSAALPIFALWMKHMNQDPYFDAVTKAKFATPDPEVMEKLDCEPVKRDGFFKRLFKNPNRKKTRKFKEDGAP